MARALRQRLGDQIEPEGPSWRPFQLAKRVEPVGLVYLWPETN